MSSRRGGSGGGSKGGGGADKGSGSPAPTNGPRLLASLETAALGQGVTDVEAMRVLASRLLRLVAKQGACPRTA